MARNSFRYHQRKIHSLGLIKKGFPFSNATIDVFDPNYHCAICDKKFVNKSVYRNH